MGKARCLSLNETTQWLKAVRRHRPWDLRHQPVHMETGKEPTDLGTLWFRVSTEAKHAVRELNPEVAVGEAVHSVLTAHEGGE